MKPEDMYYICVEQFDTPDPQDPSIAMDEWDAYGSIPYNAQEKNHRLSLSYRLAPKEFEAYRYYYNQLDPKKSRDETIFKSKNLQEVCDFINDQILYYRKHEGDFAECKHERPHMSISCEKK